MHCQSAVAHVCIAVLYATVSASFVIEQEGLPVLTHATDDEGSTECWNNETPQSRLEKLLVDTRAV